MASPKELLKKPVGRWFAHGFGSGLSPIMPGTTGSLAAVLLLAAVPVAWRGPAAAVGAVLATIGCVCIARALPPKGQGGDPGWFVLDEWAGQWLTLIPFCSSWTELLVGFVAFRVFDMTKPLPLRRLERMGGGYGIVLDDLGAGLYALAALWIYSLTLGFPN